MNPTRTSSSGPLRRSPLAHNFLLQASLAFGVVWLVTLIPLVAAGVLPGGWSGDTNLAFIPYRAYLIRSLWKGDFPDLAAGIFLGQPMMSFGQTMLVYPTTLLGLLVPLPPLVFFHLDLWLHGVGAAVGAAWLIRRRGGSRLASLALGWVYLNSSAFLFRAHGHWTLVHQAALLPWILGLWESMDRRRREQVWGTLAVLSCVVALLLLSHTPQIPFLLVVSLAPLEIARAWRRRGLIPLGRRFALLAATAALALALGAAAVAPPILAYRDSFRSLLAGPSLAAAWPLDKFNLITLVSPYLLFGDVPETFFGRWSAMESAVLVPRLVLPMAVGGLVAYAARPRRLVGRGALPLVLIGAGLFFGLAPEMPWFGFLVRWMPLFSSMRSWGRASGFVVLGLILFAATGLDALAGAIRRRNRNPLAAIAVCLLLELQVVVFLLWIFADRPERVVELIERGRTHAGAVFPSPEAKTNFLGGAQERLAVDLAWMGGGLLVVLFALGQGARGWGRWPRWAAAGLIALEASMLQQFLLRSRSRPTGPETFPELSAWIDDLRRSAAPAPVTIAIDPGPLGCFALHFEGVRGTHGADANMRRDYAVWLNEVQGLNADTYQLNAVIVNYTPALLDATALDARVIRRPPGDPPPGWTPVGPFHLALRNRAAAPYVEIRSPPGSEGRATRGIPQPSAKVVRWTDGEAEIEVDAVDPVDLIVREFPDRRWVIRHAGQRVEPTPSRDRLVIPLPPGGGRVTLDYVDRVARIATAISLASWLAVGVGAVVRRRRRRASSGVAALG